MSTAIDRAIGMVIDHAIRSKDEDIVAGDIVGNGMATFDQPHQGVAGREDRILFVSDMIVDLALLLSTDPEFGLANLLARVGLHVEAEAAGEVL